MEKLIFYTLFINLAKMAKVDFEITSTQLFDDECVLFIKVLSPFQPFHSELSINRTGQFTITREFQQKLLHKLEINLSILEIDELIKSTIERNPEVNKLIKKL